MKQVFIGLLLIFSISCIYAQNSTGINTTTPGTKAALDIRNTSGFPQGVLFPRLPGSDTTALKTGVTAREKGLTFFDTTNNVYRSWNGTKWVTFGSSSASGEAWGLYGNTLLAADTGYVSGFKYIGTNNAFPFIIATDGVERMRISRTGNVAIGMKPTGGVPLQLKSNGTGLVFRIEKSAGSTFPLFEFRQNPGNHARLLMYDGDGSSNIELNADPTSSNYFNVAKFGIGNNAPAERLHITNGALLLQGESGSPTAVPTSGSIKFQGNSGLNHVILNEATSNDLVLWHKNGATWNDYTRFNAIGEFKTGKAGANYGFVVDGTGNAVKINNVTYSWPTAQGTGVLTNDGAGGLSWASGTGITGTGSTNTIPYWTSTNSLGFSTMLYNGTAYAIGTTVSNAITFQTQSASTVTLYGQNTAAGGTAVWGYSSNTGGLAGVRGLATGTGKGVYGTSTSATGFGGHFENTAGGAAFITGPGYAGINNTDPLVSLDIEGGLATRLSATTLALAASELSLDLTNISFVRANCASPTLLKGIKAGVSGQHVFLRARAGTLTLVNSSSEAAAVDQIVTGNGTDITLTGTSSGVVHLIYEINRWYVVSPAAATPASLWTQSGTNIYNSIAGNVGIGLAAPLLPLHVYMPAAVEPPATGSSAVGALRMSTGDSPLVLDMGIADDTYYGAWLQAHYASNQASFGPILLNPNGGSVGIGITTPTSALHVSANNAINIPLAVLNSVSYGKIDFLTNGTDILHMRPSGTGGKYMYFTHASGPEMTFGSNGTSGWLGTSTTHNLSIVAGGTPRITILPTGLVGIGCTTPTVALHVSGAIRSNQAITTTALACSDMRYKTDIKTITEPVKLLQKLNGRTFLWRKDEFKEMDLPSGTHYGFIAQEIEKILPGFVYTDSTEGHFKSVEYVKLTPILVEAIKEQQKLIDSLTISNNKQDIELQQLKGAIQQKDTQLDSQKTMILKHEEELEKIRQYLGTEVKK